MLLLSKFLPVAGPNEAGDSQAVEPSIDILSFDVRLTKDNVPVLVHDPNLWRSYHIPYFVNRITYRELANRTKNGSQRVMSFEEALNIYKGTLLLNFELKTRGAAAAIIPILKRHIKIAADWELFLFSSFYSSELRDMRKHTKNAQLCLMHSINPLSFLAVNRALQLSAVGFHRLHINSVVIAVAKKLQLFSFAYTINRPEAAKRFAQLGLDGILTDTPRTIANYLKKNA